MKHRWLMVGPLVLCLLATLALLVPSIVNLRRYRERLDAVDTWPACSIVPAAAARWPYGDVRSCQLLERYPNTFAAEVEASAILLLDTDLGAVLVQVDCLSSGCGRQSMFRIVELEPSPVQWASPGRLSRTQLNRVQAGIAQRHGVQTRPFPVYAGDG